MRKIYNFLLLAVMFIAGVSVVQAEKRYQVEGDNIAGGMEWTFSDVKVGVPFVMQSGELLGGTPDFIRGLGKSKFITDENLFELEAAGENSEGESQYLLKRVATGEYLTNGSYSFDASKARAWKFIIVEPYAYSGDQIEATENCEVADWRCATTISGVAAQVIFVDANCVSDTTVTTRDNVKFLCSGGQGKAPSMGNDFTKNTWELFGVVTLEGSDYLQDAMNEIFPDGSADLFNPGTEPGQISQELYDELINSYNDAMSMIEEGVTDQATCEAAVERCKKAIENAKNGAILVKEGYYYFKSSRTANNATYDDGEGLHWTYGKEWTKPEVLDLENAKYVWYLKPNLDAEGKEDGSYFIQNFYTKRFIGVVHEKGAFVKTTEKAEETYLIYPQDKDDFIIQSTSLIKAPAVGWGGEPLTALHCPADHNNVVVWDTHAPASGWVFLNVPVEQIDNLQGQIAQDKINKQLETLLKQARTDYDKGFCFFDGNNNGALDMEEDGVTPKGLVKKIEQISTNRQESSEGPLEQILDNNVASGNFFHTDWQRNVNPEQLPFLQIDLGAAVDHIMVKMWARLNGNELFVRNLPGLVNIWVSNTPDDSASWKKVGQTTSELVWNFPESNEAGELTGRFYNNKGVAKLNADLTGKYQYVRIENERMYTNRESTADIDTANTFFNLSEIRVFEYKYIAEKSMIEAVDKTVRAEFEAAMDAAKAELEAGKATVETIDRLQAAYDKFLENYPDPQIVVRLLNEAKAQLEAAETGTEPGYFEEGAKEGLQTAITSVEAQVKEIMTLAEVQKAKAELDAALKAFNDKLIKPAEGYYYVVCESTSDATNNSAQGHMYATGNGSRVKWTKTEGLDMTVLPQAVWKLEKKENGFALKNVLTGEYMNNPRKNNAGVYAAAADTCAFGLRSAKVAGMFNLVLSDNVFLNAQPSAERNMVTWNAASGTDNSAFSFKAVPTDEYASALQWNVKANATQIITLPVDVTVYEGDGFYSVIGRNGNNLELADIDGEIKAGTPFFYEETAGESSIQIETAAQTYDELSNSWATEALSQNGLYGTLAAIDSLHPGYGLLYGNAIVDSKVGEGVANNSGYIHPSIKATTETGVKQIIIEGEITAIENVISTTPSVVNVYNLSGVKVRSNVKSANELNGLPAGIYIMGNKKVLVK